MSRAAPEVIPSRSGWAGELPPGTTAFDVSAIELSLARRAQGADGRRVDFATLPPAEQHAMIDAELRSRSLAKEAESAKMNARMIATRATRTCAVDGQLFPIALDEVAVGPHKLGRLCPHHAWLAERVWHDSITTAEEVTRIRVMLGLA